MYNPTTSSGSVSFNESLDTKYTVAELLSSLASGGLTPTSQYPTSMPSFVSDANHTAAVTSAPALLTPGTLLTPSTLNSIEQTFIELQNVPSTTTGSHVTESGFVPPIVSTSQQQYQNPSSAPSGQNPNMVIKQEYPGHESYYSDESSQDPDWASEPSPKRMRNGDGNAVSSTSSGRRTGPRGRRQDSDLSHDELEKRQVRRERNKLAAAKCRQRRVDLTNTLQVQTEGLENEKQSLESEIQQLQSQKEQLEFLLQAHTPVCSVKGKLAATSSAALSRPTSLPLTSTVTTHAVSVTVSEALGVPITTPSSSMFGTLGLDSMMDGHTGLTPLTGAAPSCASEVQRSHSDNSGSSPSDLASPTTLMAL